MSVKHNVSHKVRFGRGRSHYPDRLHARGLAKAPALAEIEGPQGLRERQLRRVRETCTLGPTHDEHRDDKGKPIRCNGHPWRVFGTEVEETDAKADLAASIERLAEHYAKAA